jgi:deazaflavin-dependent oxidoreductase (nitroreductase family)
VRSQRDVEAHRRRDDPAIRDPASEATAHPAIADTGAADHQTPEGLRSAAVDDRDAIVRSLLDERTVDIVTTGRRSGAPRTTEIWTTVVDGQTYICGTPNASQPGVERRPRDWLANLVAFPEFIVRLKTSVHVDLPATARRVDDQAERRRVLTAPDTEFYRNAVSLEAAIAHSPLVRVQFTGDAAWLATAIRTGRAPA